MRVDLRATKRDKYERRTRIEAVLDMTPDEVEDWVDRNVNDFEDVKRLLKRLAVLAIAAHKRLDR